MSCECANPCTCDCIACSVHGEHLACRDEARAIAVQQFLDGEISDSKLAEVFGADNSKYQVRINGLLESDAVNEPQRKEIAALYVSYNWQQAEIERLKERDGQLCGELAALVSFKGQQADEIARLEATNAALVKALEICIVHGHHDTCSYALVPQCPCDCGYRAAQNALAAAGKLTNK